MAGGKKKKTGKKKGSASAKEVASKPSTEDIRGGVASDDVSLLLFGSQSAAANTKLPFQLPFVGSIELIEKSHDDSSNVVIHGRGLVATRDISPGEAIFITPPIVSTPVDEVRRRYLQMDAKQSDGVLLEQITEEVLVEQVQSLCQLLEDEELHPKESVDIARRLLGAVVAQMSSEDVPQTDMDVLLAASSQNDTINPQSQLDNTTILNTIRRNAFGPDFNSYNTIATSWSNKHANEALYTRLLGLYPLAAMINHSCCPNAVRVFGTLPAINDNMHRVQGREVMIVHATAKISKGDEITWSYLPPCSPFNERRAVLSSKFGFTCQCVRCIKEETVFASDGRADQCWKLADDWWQARQTQQSSISNLIQTIEQSFASDKTMSNEIQRYLRVGYASLYMDHFNSALSSSSGSNDLLKLATQLHFSFLSCNNASTEHLSILHLCYELSALLHMHATRQDPDATIRTMTQVRFWTEQLKTAHMIRYGSLGKNLESVREAMKHSKLVLRNKDGWYMTKDRFI